MSIISNDRTTPSFDGGINGSFNGSYNGSYNDKSFDDIVVMTENFVEVADGEGETLSEGLTSDSGEKQFKIRGKFATIESRNKNGRFYPRALWEREVQKFQEYINKGTLNTLMEWDHPADRLDVDPQEAVAKITKLWIDGDYVMGEAIIFDVPKAQIIKSMIKHGVQISVSSRARGSCNPQGMVEQFELITFDLVATPSDNNATMYGLFEKQMQKLKETSMTENDKLVEGLVDSIKAKNSHIQDLNEEVSILRAQLGAPSYDPNYIADTDVHEVPAVRANREAMLKFAEEQGSKYQEEHNEYTLRSRGAGLTQTHRHQDASLLRDSDPSNAYSSGEAEVLKVARMLMSTFGRDKVVGSLLSHDVDTGSGMRGASADVEYQTRRAEMGHRDFVPHRTADEHTRRDVNYFGHLSHINDVEKVGDLDGYRRRSLNEGRMFENSLLSSNGSNRSNRSNRADAFGERRRSKRSQMLFEKARRRAERSTYEFLNEGFDDYDDDHYDSLLEAEFRRASRAKRTARANRSALMERARRRAERSYSENLFEGLEDRDHLYESKIDALLEAEFARAEEAREMALDMMLEAEFKNAETAEDIAVDMMFEAELSELPTGVEDEYEEDYLDSDYGDHKPTNFGYQNSVRERALNSLAESQRVNSLKVLDAEADQHLLESRFGNGHTYNGMNFDEAVRTRRKVKALSEAREAIRSANMSDYRTLNAVLESDVTSVRTSDVAGIADNLGLSVEASAGETQAARIRHKATKPRHWNFDEEYNDFYDEDADNSFTRDRTSQRLEESSFDPHAEAITNTFNNEDKYDEIDKYLDSIDGSREERSIADNKHHYEDYEIDEEIDEVTGESVDVPADFGMNVNTFAGAGLNESTFTPATKQFSFVVPAHLI